jgi:hypothetical protein
VAIKPSMEYAKRRMSMRFGQRPLSGMAASRHPARGQRECWPLSPRDAQAVGTPPEEPIRPRETCQRGLEVAFPRFQLKHDSLASLPDGAHALGRLTCIDDQGRVTRLGVCNLPPAGRPRSAITPGATAPGPRTSATAFVVVEAKIRTPHRRILSVRASAVPDVPHGGRGVRS